MIKHSDNHLIKHADNLYSTPVFILVLTKEEIVTAKTIVMSLTATAYAKTIATTAYAKTIVCAKIVCANQTSVCAFASARMRGNASQCYRECSNLGHALL